MRLKRILSSQGASLCACGGTCHGPPPDSLYESKGILQPHSTPPTGKRSQADQKQEKGGLDVGASTTTAGEPWKAPAGLSKAFESNCTVTTASSDDSGSESSRSSRSGLGDLVVDLEEAELAVALAFRSLDEALHPHHAADHHQHHHHPQQRRRRHQRKAAAHLSRLHSHADLDVHAPIRFLI